MVDIKYNSVIQLIQSDARLLDKINAVSGILDELYTTMLKYAGNADVARHTVDDGQINTSVEYTNLKSLTETISQFERMEERLINKYNRLKVGDIINLRDRRAML